MKILLAVILVLGYVAWKEIPVIKETVISKYYAIIDYVVSKITQAKSWVINLLS